MGEFEDQDDIPPVEDLDEQLLSLLKKVIPQGKPYYVNSSPLTASEIRKALEKPPIPVDLPWYYIPADDRP